MGAHQVCGNGQRRARELRRIYDRALTAGVISTRSAVRHGASVPTRGLAVPLRHHRGDFFRMERLRLAGSRGSRLTRKALRLPRPMQAQNRRRQASAGETQYQNGWRGVRRIAAPRHSFDASIEPLGMAPRRRTVFAASAHPCRLRQRAHAPAEQNTGAAHGVIFSITTRSTSSYEPFAPEPRQWLDFLNQLWGDDQQAIDTLQEIFRILPDCRHEPAKAFTAE